MARRVAVVTDSTASLPPGLAGPPGSAEILVVPLQVVVDGVGYREGIDLGPGRLVEALRSGASVTTSQPGPETFAEVYRQATAAGAREIVSVHLSGRLSGTVASAEAAARTCDVPVHVVDSLTVGMALGFAALRASASRADADPDVVARSAERVAAGSTVLFAVDSLEHLRRGGRLGPMAATLGTVLGLRPVLGVRDGRLEVVEKARTGARARERVIELTAADALRRGRCDLAVHHLGQPESAQEVAERLRAACGAAVREVHVAEISAVVGAHVGPGLLATVVSDAPEGPDG